MIEFIQNFLEQSINNNNYSYFLLNRQYQWGNIKLTLCGTVFHPCGDFNVIKFPLFDK